MVVWMFQGWSRYTRRALQKEIRRGVVEGGGCDVHKLWWREILPRTTERFYSFGDCYIFIYLYKYAVPIPGHNSGDSARVQSNVETLRKFRRLGYTTVARSRFADFADGRIIWPNKTICNWNATLTVQTSRCTRGNKIIGLTICKSLYMCAAAGGALYVVKIVDNSKISEKIPAVTKTFFVSERQQILAAVRATL